MGKSKYPNKLDTSIEIPAVRDNIVEVGSDVLNSLRSAIFNIERTLGINPQGATGNTVASRINRALDGNGNIQKDALDKAGLLSGPITNSDVSNSAAINESKLNLEYPTTLLQDEISQLIKQIKTISETLEELAYLYAAHTHPEAKDRHTGNAISIEAIDKVSSEVGIVSSERQTAQELFENIFSSHINYDGTNISKENRSHEAKQLFFDKEDVSAYIYSDDVQGAIIDVLNQTMGQVEGHQNLHHSNGALRTSTIIGTEDRTAGQLLLEEQTNITYSKYSSNETTRLSAVAFADLPPLPEYPIERSDILRIYSGLSDGHTDYQVHSVQDDGTNIISITIFGALDRDSDPLDTVKVFKNKNMTANFGGLLTTARYFPGALNRNIIQVANPNSSTIITKGVRPSEISITNRYFNISVDDGDDILLDVYDGSAPGGQSIDTIIKAMNTEFAERGASVSAYRVDYDDLNSPEIALVHSLPSTSSEAFTLKVKESLIGSDALDSLGLAHLKDMNVGGGSGSEYLIQGETYSGLGLKLEIAGLDLLQGTASLTSHAIGIDLDSYGIAKGDLIVITGTDSDDGTYVIDGVTPTSITVDNGQLEYGSYKMWNGEAGETSKFYVLKSTLSLEDFEFLLRPSGGGSNACIVDVFMDKERDVFYNARLYYAVPVDGGSNSLISPCDFYGDISVYTDSDPGVIEATVNADGNPELALDGGTKVELLDVNSSHIRLKSGLYNISFMVFIESSNLIKQKIINDGIPFQVNLYGEEGVNEEENMLLSRVHYDSMFSRITGAGPDLPKIFKKLEAGITSDKDLSSKALDRVYQGPIRETRSNGVTRGLELTPSLGYGAHDSIDGNGNYVVNISGGTCYIRGKKFEFTGYSNLISNVVASPPYGGTADKVFVAINEWGEIVFSEAGGGGGGGGSCACPFDADSHCILSVLEFDGVNPPVAIDLRLFLNDLDLKVLNSITVSPQRGMGHFTDFGEAVKYAKRFGDLFPNAGTPTIHLKSGTHKVVVNTGNPKGASALYDPNLRQAASYAGIWINFPVNIRGEGHSTVLDIMTIYSDQGEDGDDRIDAEPYPVDLVFENNEPDHAGYLFIAGPGLDASRPNGNADVLSDGLVTLSNFRMKNCAVAVLDPHLLSSAPASLDWGLRVDGMIFDRTEKPDFAMHNYSVMFVNVDSVGGAIIDGGEYIGNLIVNDSQFLNSYALFTAAPFLVENHRNISFAGNSFRGPGYPSPMPGFPNAYWISWNDEDPGGENLFRLESASWLNNIEYRNNTFTDSVGNPGGVPTGIDGALTAWGDRISGSLAVGYHLGVGVNCSDTYPLMVDNGGAYGAWIKGDSILEGSVTVSSNLSAQSFNLTNDFTISNGDFTITSGDLNLNDGDISVRDSEALLTLTSTSGAASTCSVIRLQKEEDIITSGTDLGEIRFRGKEPAMSWTTGAMIMAEATGGWSSINRPTSLSFSVTEDVSLTTPMKLTGDGVLRLSGGSNIYTGDRKGCIQIGQTVDDFGNGSHIAIDNNMIQSRTAQDAASSDTLWLNYDGGYVVIGKGSTTEHRLLINGNTISNNDGNTVYVDDNISVIGNVSCNKIFAETSTTTEDSPAARFTGKSSNSNDGTTNIFGGGVVQIHDYQADGQDGSALNITLKNLNDSDDYEDGTPVSEGADWFIGFWDNNNESVGFISREGGSMVYGGFTGSHITPVDDSELHDLKIKGLIVSSTGVAMTDKSLVEPYVGTTLTRKEKDKSVLGVICRGPKLYREGIKLATWNEDVHGIVVNSVGNGRIWVTNIAGDIENGDFICSSNIPGYGQMQDDDLMHNYTVAKATEAVDWDNVTDVITHEGVTHKRFLIACSYHCG
jgi:hypothetical protein